MMSLGHPRSTRRSPDRTLPLCPLTSRGLALGWGDADEFYGIYVMGPPYVEDLGPGFWRPWRDQPEQLQLPFAEVVNQIIPPDWDGRSSLQERYESQFNHKKKR